MHFFLTSYLISNIQSVALSICRIADYPQMPKCQDMFFFLLSRTVSYKWTRHLSKSVQTKQTKFQTIKKFGQPNTKKTSDIYRKHERAKCNVKIIRVA